MLAARGPKARSLPRQREFERPSIAALIVSCNEADVIELCLESVRGWVDEIVVIDMESTDGTHEIVRRYTDRLITHERLSYVEPARNFALAQTTADWVLILDPDERVSPALAHELRQIADQDAVDAVIIPFRHVAFGRVMSSPGLSDFPHPRFFRAGSITWPAEIHQSPDLTSLRCQTLLTGPEDVSIHHDTWRSTPVILEKLRRYAPNDAMRMRAEGQSFSVVRLLFYPLGVFVKYWIDGRGYRDGMAGFLMALYHAFYHLTVQTEIWEQEGRTRKFDRRIRRWGSCLYLPYRVLRPLGLAVAKLCGFPLVQPKK